MDDLIKPGDTISFTEDIFITDYFDKENDSPYEVQILNDMQYGVLLFDNTLVKANFIFKLSEVNKLVYTRLSSEAYEENINFKTSDDNPNKLFSNMATMTINVNAYVNLPPDAIGDNEITINHGETRVFTVEDFTTNTTPAYNDPEGDAPLKLKVLSLPIDGELLLNDVPVTINQEILFTDITSGLFTFEPDIEITTEDIVSFDFDIADVGSEEYSGL